MTTLNEIATIVTAIGGVELIKWVVTWVTTRKSTQKKVQDKGI